MTYHPRAHFDDCRSSICGGCYDDPLADLGAAARAALVAAGKAIVPKTFELDEREELAAGQRREFGSSWDEMVYTEGRTLGWIIESVIEDVLASPALARERDELQARLDAIAEFAGHPGNWSASEYRGRLIHNLATGSIDPASRDWSDTNLPPKEPT